MSRVVSFRADDAVLEKLDTIPGATRAAKLENAIMQQRASDMIARAVAQEIKKGLEPVAQLHADVKELLGEIARLRARLDDYTSQAAAATRAAGEMSSRFEQRITERDEKLRAVISAIRMSLARLEAAAGIAARA